MRPRRSGPRSCPRCCLLHRRRRRARALVGDGDLDRVALQPGTDPVREGDDDPAGTEDGDSSDEEGDSTSLTDAEVEDIAQAAVDTDSAEAAAEELEVNAADLDTLFDLHDQRWASEGGSDAFDDPIAQLKATEAKEAEKRAQSDPDDKDA